MPKVMTCDICGAPDADEDYEGTILCTYHRAERELGSLQAEYKDKREWVKSVWLSRLAGMRQEITRLKRIVVENKPAEKPETQSEYATQK